MPGGLRASDDITISGGGRVAVATADIFSAATRLERVAAELEDGRALLRHAGSAVPSGQWHLVDATDAAARALRAERAIDDAAAGALAAETVARVTAGSLRIGADAYGWVEQTIASSAQSIAAHVGWFLGATGGFLAVLFAPQIAGAAVLGLSAYGLARLIDPEGTAREVHAAGDWLASRRAILSDPGLIAVLRLGVMSVDDVELGLIHVPPAVAGMLGDEGKGILGLDTATASVVALGGIGGLLRETPVTTAAVRSAPSTPVSGFADRAARVPTGDTQVRIDRYHRPGEPDTFEVYVGGTADFSLTATDEPWDMTSNVVGVAGGQSGSERAVREALAAAGATAGSSIAITGYSQGGLVAARLAASGDYSVRGIVTLGAPAAQVAVPKAVPWAAIEHTDDLVPATGGTWASDDPVVVHRRALEHPPDGDGLMFPAHQLSEYRETAALSDAADESRLEAVRSALDTGTAGATVESTWYRAERVAPVPETPLPTVPVQEGPHPAPLSGGGGRLAR